MSSPTNNCITECDSGVQNAENRLESEESSNVPSNQKPNTEDTLKTTGNPDFYQKAKAYWAQIPATVNGMLGGLGYISMVDIQGSEKFLRELRLPTNCNKVALDIGAGIGRVSKNLLMPRFASVDLVEQDTNFAQVAREYCTTDGCPNRLGEIFNVGLQEFSPEQAKYDLIWSQWVLGHLTDEDLLDFFRRIQSGLTQDGRFVMKENVTSGKEIEKDETDSSVTRPLRTYEKLLRKSGFRVVKTTRQLNFPKGLYPVYMIACRAEQKS